MSDRGFRGCHDIWGARMVLTRSIGMLPRQQTWGHGVGPVFGGMRIGLARSAPGRRPDSNFALPVHTFADLAIRSTINS
ncbi:hypothetical protein BDP81DRAFT_430996 [Colletotrichum phormii]|uniref:Uncharacterized protein n=1 Tax=Colletotrichum phormii TaxID=359342 RepID=A0AAI9ZNE8_9PEZI|nr:uncharacterized protein BDP81DRAFT_430996 [Colletotrichum phormii]KAK1635195.1 hypothetical protein BDP81DRAFT_430996 [Colletotrichum phormii]